MESSQYDQLRVIPVKEDQEPLVELQTTVTNVIFAYNKKDMLAVTGSRMFARKSVAERLDLAQKALQKHLPSAQFRVVYAYRTPEIQQCYFEQRCEELKILNPEMDEQDIKRKAHLLSASPDVAGHTSGAALDLTITTEKGEMDMGTPIADFRVGNAIQMFFPHLTMEQKDNRALLRSLMMEQVFAPFDGEWWHFSYGDREWALFYQKPHAIYGQIELDKKETL